jgi:tetratricopeptide (TPR) repeat protein
VRQYDRAIESELKCLQRAPKSFWPYVVLGWAYQQKGMQREAVAEMQEAVRLTAGKMMFALAAYAQALAVAGDRQGARTVVAQLKDQARTRYVSAYDVAIVYAALNDRDAAFAWLDTAREEHSSFLPYITWDRRADVLRGDPRYTTLLRQLGLRAN